MFSQDIIYTRIKLKSGGIQLSWNDSDKYSLYKIERATATSSQYETIGIFDDTLFVDAAPPQAATYRVRGLVDNTSTQYFVVNTRFYSGQLINIDTTYYSTDHRTGLLVTEETFRSPFDSSTIRILTSKDSLLSFTESVLAVRDFGNVELMETRNNQDLMNRTGASGILGGNCGYSYGQLEYCQNWAISEESDSTYVIERQIEDEPNSSVTWTIDKQTGLVEDCTFSSENSVEYTAFGYTFSNGIPCIHEKIQYRYRSNCLISSTHSAYHLIALNQTTIPGKFSDYTSVPLEQLPALPTMQETHVNRRNCPVLASMEDFTFDNSSQRTSCNSCHESVPPYTFLLVHGLGSNSETWGKLRSYLEDNYNAVVLVPQYPGSSTLSQAANSINQFITDYSLPIDVAIGHSQGGLILRKIARDEPVPRFNHLITIGTPHYGTAIADNIDSVQDHVHDVVHELSWAKRGLILHQIFQYVFNNGAYDEFPQALTLGALVLYVSSRLEDYIRGELDKQIFDLGAMNDLKTDSDFITDLNSNLDPLDYPIPIHNIATHSANGSMNGSFVEELIGNSLYSSASVADDFDYSSLDSRLENSYHATDGNVFALYMFMRHHQRPWEWCRRRKAADRISEFWYMWKSWMENYDRGEPVPYYSYHPIGEDYASRTIFFCAYPPTYTSSLPVSASSREAWCHKHTEEDGADFYECWGAPTMTAVCYLGDGYPNATYLAHDGLVITERQVMPQNSAQQLSTISLSTGPVCHTGQTKSYRVFEEIDSRLELW